MSEDETFVARWSRRKRAGGQQNESAQPAAPAEQGAEAPELSVGASRGPQKTRSVFGGAPHASPLRSHPDAPASAAEVEAVGPDATPVPELPPIESIVAESDVRAFLAPGVPAELTRAALRRAWSLDPKIRDFIGLSENSWDFNDPGAIPGFGPLELTDELRREIARMIGRSMEEKAPEPPTCASPNAEQAEAQPAAAQAEVVALPADPPPLPAGQEERLLVTENDGAGPSPGAPDPAGWERREHISKRRHGGALPQ